MEKVKFVRKEVDGDTFFVRKYKRHWWQLWTTTRADGKEARFDYISGWMYQRMEQNYYTKCPYNAKAKRIIRF